MKKRDIEKAFKEAYRKKGIQITRAQLDVIHTRGYPEKHEEAQAKLSRLELHIVGITSVLEEVQRETGVTLQLTR